MTGIFHFLITITLLFCTIFSVGMPFSYSNDWKRAVAPWRWSFPRDHGSHGDFRTEWWYFTGNLRDPAGSRYGYQLTFFRQGILRETNARGSSWSIRDIYFAHFAITDVKNRRFWFSERISRRGPGLSGSSEEAMNVWLLNWFARMEENRIRLEARDEGMGISFELTPGKPVALHGENGLSRKGPREGQASYYYSYTSLYTTGHLSTKGHQPVPVKGRSWFDHEFGSNQLSPEQTGWDWMSLHLSDGQDLMLYFLRRKDGTVEKSSSGTLVTQTGTSLHLRLDDIRVTVTDSWKSPSSGAIYPARWRIAIPRAQLELEISPLVKQQEIISDATGRVTYWEGAVEGQGFSKGKKVACEGYVELTGYARSLGSLF